jgi:CRISPR/Cas system-associated protein Csm6
MHTPIIIVMSMPLPTANANAVEEQKKENALHKELDETVKQESRDEKVYEALRNFLLADPERQIHELGGTEKLLAEADRAKSKNLEIVARAMYETAAKVAIYKQNKDEARKIISLADEVTKPGDTQKEIHETLISNMDEVMNVSKDYYDKMAEKKQANS